MVDRLENGVSNDTAKYCGEIELKLVNNRDDAGSPFSFVVIDDTSKTLEIWCDHPESVGSHEFGV